MKSSKDVLAIIEKDSWMMDILTTARLLNLPDWWICAGFVRSKIWDTLHGYRIRTIIPDIDLIYFDKTNISEENEKKLEKQLFDILPTVPWSVKNEARMHTVNNIEPYKNSIDAISKFPETATALGVTIDHTDQLHLAAPLGLQDVLEQRVKPTPFFIQTEARLLIYQERKLQKNWKASWPGLNFE